MAQGILSETHSETGKGNPEIAEPYQINIIAPVETMRNIIIKIVES